MERGWGGRLCAWTGRRAVRLFAGLRVGPEVVCIWMRRMTLGWG